MKVKLQNRTGENLILARTQRMNTVGTFLRRWRK